MEKNMRLGPTVDQVTEALIPIYEGYVYRKKLIAQLNEQLGTHNLKFQSEKNAFFIMDKIAVSGWYDPVDDIRMINIVHAPGLKKLFIPDLTETDSVDEENPIAKIYINQNDNDEDI